MIMKIGLAVLLISVPGVVFAQNHSLKKNVVASGGSSSQSTSYQMKSTNGQTVIYFTSSGNSTLKAGFWPKGGIPPEPIPTLSEWGMILLSLLLLAFGTVAVIRRRRVAVNEA